MQIPQPNGFAALYRSPATLSICIFQSMENSLKEMSPARESRDSKFDKKNNNQVVDMDRIQQQMLYKDQRIIELNNNILEKERQILDLQVLFPFFINLFDIILGNVPRAGRSSRCQEASHATGTEEIRGDGIEEQERSGHRDGSLVPGEGKRLGQRRKGWWSV